MKNIIAIDLGGTNIKAALLDARCRIGARKVITTQKDNLVETLVCAVGDIMREHAIRARSVAGVGLGVPGPVDARRGIVHFLPNIPGIRETPLKRILERKLSLPVMLDNDAKLMALGEFICGAARGCENVLCLTLGTGVGGGLILNGRLYRGLDNAAGELGHVPINETGPSCNCGGAACLEAYVGNARIRERIYRVFRRVLPLEEVSAMARRGDARALAVWRDVGTKLGVALSGVVNLLNLDAIVIGGGVANAGRILFDTVGSTVRERAMSVQAGRVKVLRARLGNDAGLIGAAIMVTQRKDNQ